MIIYENDLRQYFRSPLPDYHIGGLYGMKSGIPGAPNSRPQNKNWNGHI